MTFREAFRALFDWRTPRSNALPADQKDERRLGNAHDDLKARVKGSRL